MSDSNIPRRKFLTASLMATSALLLAKCGVPQSGNAGSDLPGRFGNQADVIIVGAGIAGLAAARTLIDDGWQVIVLEGRDRIGGRLWTDRSLGLPLDLGASWIHGPTGNPITALAATAGAKTVVTDMDSNVLYLSNGAQVNQEDKQAMNALFDELMVEVRTMQESAEGDMPLAEAIQQALEDRSLSTQELRGFQFAVTTAIEHEFAADSEELGLYGFDEGEVFEGEDVIFPGGYDQITTLLADQMDIRTGHRVQSIHTSDEGVKVATSQGDFQAAQAVITLPLGVLQAGDVTFDPPLPEAKLTAIQSLGMGLLNKVYLKFNEAFWSRDNTTLINYIADQQDAWAETLNLYPLLNEPILLMFNAGSFGREIETWQDEEIVAAAMKVLRTLYGNGIPDPESVLITRWASDPFTHGSYSFLPVNAGPETRLALAESVDDRLYFAGEATSVDYPATVHGAYLSGVAAANQIMESA